MTSSAPVKPIKRRRLTTKEVISLCPLTDEDGLLYSSREVRFMRKCTKREGEFSGHLTAEQRNSLKENDRGKKVDEVEFISEFQVDHNEEVMEDGGESDGDEGDENQDKSSEEESSDCESVTDEVKKSEGAEVPEKKSNAVISTSVTTMTSSKSKRAQKPPPAGYVCAACNGELGDSPHWIYDCPTKQKKKPATTVTPPPTPPSSKNNKKHKKTGGTGVHDPSENKVFISGLPFDCKESEVREFFSNKTQKNDRIVDVQLMRFKDTEKNKRGRCNGQAIVKFLDPSDAKRSMGEFDGKSWGKRTIRVSKLLNRTLTNGKKNKRKREGNGSN